MAEGQESNITQEDTPAPEEGQNRWQRLIKHPWVPRIATALWIGILGLAVWALHEQWRDLQFSDFVEALGRIGPAHITLALLFTACSYLCNSALDLWAMRHLRVEKKIPWPVALRTSFVAMVFSINAGGAILSGGSVRLRTYPRFGMKPMELAGLMVFNGVVAWAGFCLNAGVNLTLSTDALPGLPAWVSAGWAGPAFLAMGLAVVLLFMAIRAGRLTSWVPDKWKHLAGVRQEGQPGPRLGFIPVGALSSACDYFFAGLTLRALFPEVHGIHFSTFLAVFALSQAAAAISHVPAGAGVLEILLTALLSQSTDTASLASSLLAFRVIFYMLPFGLAALILFSWEVWIKRLESKDMAPSGAG
jgi:phosphatidylglycerol lysyltransferase